MADELPYGYYYIDHLDELVKENKDMIYTLSPANADIISLKDYDEIVALLWHWGYDCKYYTNKNNTYYTRVGKKYYSSPAEARQAILKIIHEHSDPETGLMIL